MGWDGLNQLATIGGFVIALAVVVFLVNVIKTSRRGEVASADPWDGRTLEWSIPSPVPEYNFAEIPEVHAADDFWHRKYTEDEEGRLVRLPAGGADDGHVQGNGHGIHLPSPSFFPLILALGLPILGYAAVFKIPWLAIPGVLVLLFGMFSWTLEPGTAED
jgi:cytochrome c oxidase subunit 1